MQFHEVRIFLGKGAKLTAQSAFWGQEDKKETEWKISPTKN
jgi:hypothetical protein